MEAVGRGLNVLLVGLLVGGVIGVVVADFHEQLWELALRIWG